MKKAKAWEANVVYFIDFIFFDHIIIFLFFCVKNVNIEICL